MKRKMKRYSGEDGESEVIDMRSDTSQPTGIDDDVRARAMKFLQTGKKNNEISEPNTVVKKITKTVVDAPKDYSDQADRRSKQLNIKEFDNLNRLKAYDKPLEEVHPEDYIPGGGVLKGLLKGAGRLASRQAEKKALQESQSGGFSFADKLARDEKQAPDLVDTLSKTGNRLKDFASDVYKKTTNPTEVKRMQAYDDVASSIMKKGGKVKAFKQGGDVRTSSSKRGDGIAVKGFTRGKIC